MRFVQLTPGTGTFHCGACVRDNALVRALREQGHDAVLAPLYLPMVLDEPNTSPSAPVLFGGVNVYLQHKSALFRKTPAWVDSLFNASWLLGAIAKLADMTTPDGLGQLTLSTLQGEEGLQAKEVAKVAEWSRRPPRPDVVCLSNALLVGLARRVKQSTGAAIVCTLQGEDAFLDSLPEPERTQCWQTLRQRSTDVDLFIAPSRYYAEVMGTRLALPEAKLRVVPNGIDPAGYSPAPPPSAPTLGYLARLCPAKGLGTLVEAYLLLKERNRVPGLRLKVAGTITAADRPYVARLQQRLRQRGCEGDVDVRFNLDRSAKIEFLRSLSVFSVPAAYGEAFGLYILEALAAGVPVVQPRCGAFSELVATTGGGVLCEPDDPLSLAHAIENLLTHPEKRAALAQRGRAVVMERFTHHEMARAFVATLERVVPQHCQTPAK